jgi:hypothetical protein
MPNPAETPAKRTINVTAKSDCFLIEFLNYPIKERIIICYGVLFGKRLNFPGPTNCITIPDE